MSVLLIFISTYYVACKLDVEVFCESLKSNSHHPECYHPDNKFYPTSWNFVNLWKVFLLCSWMLSYKKIRILSRKIRNWIRKIFVSISCECYSVFSVPLRRDFRRISRIYLCKQPPSHVSRSQSLGFHILRVFVSIMQSSHSIIKISVTFDWCCLSYSRSAPFINMTMSSWHSSSCLLI